GLAEQNHLKDRQEHLKRLAELMGQLERNTVQSRSAQLTMLKTQNELRLKELDGETAEQTARGELEVARRRAELLRGPRNRQLVQDVAEGKVSVSSIIKVTAPVAGRIGTLSVGRQGEAVERGKTLMTLLPDGPLVAEVRIANRDVALVRVGQRVKLKLD